MIKDFNDLHIGLRTGILTILCQIPFFFISIFLFKKEIIEKISDFPLSDMDFYFLISICFCLSLTWFFMNVALSFIVFKIVDKVENSESELSEIYTASLIYSIFYLGALIIISKYLNLTFYWFLITAYLFILFRIIVVLIAAKLSKSI